ncbi:MAG: DciA family protein [Pseudomonadota bacterium]
MNTAPSSSAAGRGRKGGKPPKRTGPRGAAAKGGASVSADPEQGRDIDGARRDERRSATTHGLTAATDCVKDAFRAAAGKRGIAEARLITHWPEIIGAELARVSRPIRVKPPRGLALGGVLVLAVDGARASEVEHAIPVLIERVNAHYGYGAVLDVQLTQATTGGFYDPEAGPKRPRAARPDELPEDQRARLDAMTRPIQNGALRDALQRLGANVIARSEAKKAVSEPSSGASRGVVRSLFDRR